MARVRSATEQRSFPKDSVAKPGVGGRKIDEIEIEQNGGLFPGGIDEVGPVRRRGIVLEREVDVGVVARVAARARSEQPNAPEVESLLRLLHDLAKGRRARECLLYGSLVPVCGDLDHDPKVPSISGQRHRIGYGQGWASKPGSR